MCNCLCVWRAPSLGITLSLPPPCRGAAGRDANNRGRWPHGAEETRWSAHPMATWHMDQTVTSAEADGLDILTGADAHPAPAASCANPRVSGVCVCACVCVSESQPLCVCVRVLGVCVCVCGRGGPHSRSVRQRAPQM